MYALKWTPTKSHQEESLFRTLYTTVMAGRCRSRFRNTVLNLQRGKLITNFPHYFRYSKRNDIMVWTLGFNSRFQCNVGRLVCIHHPWKKYKVERILSNIFLLPQEVCELEI